MFDRFRRHHARIKDADAVASERGCGRPFQPALTIKDRLVYVGIPVSHSKKKGQMAMAIDVYTSERKHFRLNGDNLALRNFATPFSVKAYAAAIPGDRWAEEGDYGREAFEAGATVAPKDVLERVINLLEEQIAFSNPAHYELVGLWAIGTYFHPVFDAYPYLHLRGAAGSGKTKTLSAVCNLALNGLPTAYVTPASVRRVVQLAQPTLGVDEAENVNENLACVLRSGYRRGQPAIIGGTRRDMVDRCDAYGPKMLASIRPIKRPCPRDARYRGSNGSS